MYGGVQGHGTAGEFYAQGRLSRTASVLRRVRGIVNPKGLVKYTTEN